MATRKRKTDPAPASSEPTPAVDTRDADAGLAGAPAPSDVAAAVQSLAPDDDGGDDAAPDATAPDAGLSQTPGAIRARRHRERKRSGSGGSSGTGRRRGAPSKADLQAEIDALNARLKLHEHPEDAERQRQVYHRALAATFTGLSFAVAHNAPELVLTPEETNYLADAWVPVAEMHGEQVARYLPYLSGVGALVMVFGPKYQRYSARVARDGDEKPLDPSQEVKFRAGERQPHTPELSRDDAKEAGAPAAE